MPHPPQQHTPEPWRVGGPHLDSGTLPIISADETYVAEANGRDYPELMEANADRIVACVNACAGINPEAVPDMLEALRTLLDTYLRQMVANIPMKVDADGRLAFLETTRLVISIRAAIAKATNP